MLLFLFVHGWHHFSKGFKTSLIFAHLFSSTNFVSVTSSLGAYGVLKELMAGSLSAPAFPVVFLV